VLSAIVYGGGFLLQVASPNSLKFLMIDMMPQCGQVLFGTTAAARACTFALAVFMLLPTHRCVTPRRFHPFVIGSYLVPLILEQSYVALDPCIYTGNRSVVSAAIRDEFDEWFADPALQMRQAYWHAILYDFYFVCLGALSGLFQEWVLIVGCVALVLSQRQFARSYSSLALLALNQDGSPYEDDPFALRQLWFYRIIPLVWGVLVTVLIQSGQRKEFRVRLLLQRIKE